MALSSWPSVPCIGIPMGSRPLSRQAAVMSLAMLEVSTILRHAHRGVGPAFITPASELYPRWMDTKDGRDRCCLPVPKDGESNKIGLLTLSAAWSLGQCVSAGRLCSIGGGE